MRRYEISDHDWQRLSPLLPGKPTDVGRTARDNLGPWNSVYQRFRRWASKGVWQRLFEQLQEPDLDWLLPDSTTVRAHQHAAGQKNDGPGRGPGA